MSERKGGAALSPDEITEFDSAINGIEKGLIEARRARLRGDDKRLRVALCTIHVNAEYLYNRRP